MKWEYLREEEFEGAIEKSGGLCVIPLGCTEKHGQHLPVGQDTLVARGIVEKAAELEDVMIFPATMWLGDVVSYHSRKDPGKVHNRGGIGMNPHTLLTVLEELCDEIARNGFRKILLVNNHGGNIGLLNYFARSLGYSGKNYALLYTSATGTVTNPEEAYNAITARREEFPDVTDADLEALQRYIPTGYGGGHGHFTETVLTMGLYPGLCATDKFEAESGLSTHRADYLADKGITFVNGWSANFPNNYGGFAPHGASEAIGRAFAKLAAERLAGIYKLLKEDEDCVRMAQRLPKLDK